MIGGANPKLNLFLDLPDELKSNVYKFLSCEDIILKSSDEYERNIILRNIFQIGRNKFPNIWDYETKDAIDNEEKFRIFKKLCLKNGIKDIDIKNKI